MDRQTPSRKTPLTRPTNWVRPANPPQYRQSFSPVSFLQLYLMFLFKLLSVGRSPRPLSQTPRGIKEILEGGLLII